MVSGLQQREELRGALFRALAEPQATVDEHAPPEVSHYIYRLNGLGQYTLPRLGRHAGEQCAYQDRQAVKRLLRRYQLAQSRVHAGEKPLREYYQVRAPPARRGPALSRHVASGSDRALRALVLSHRAISILIS